MLMTTLEAKKTEFQEVADALLMDETVLNVEKRNIKDVLAHLDDPGMGLYIHYIGANFVEIATLRDPYQQYQGEVQDQLSRAGVLLQGIGAHYDQ